MEVKGAAIRNRHFNRVSKGWESRPTGESFCDARDRHPENDQQQLMMTRSRERQEKPQKVVAGVTLKTDTQFLTGHRKQARRAEEEWTNQWRIWTGDTLRL